MSKFLFFLIPLFSFQQKPIDVFVDKSHSTISILYDDKIDLYDLNDNFYLISFLTKAMLKIKFRLQTCCQTKVGTGLTHSNNFSK
jgi:hypothetical protein